MPFLTPPKSGVHRTACFALYRALLQESSRVTSVQLPFVGSSLVSSKRAPCDEQKDEYTVFDALRKQFRASTRLQGHQIRSAFQIGYETLHVLRSIESPLAQSALSNLVRDLQRLYPYEPSLPCSASAQPSRDPHVDQNGTTPAGRLKDGPRVWHHPLTSPKRAHILNRPLPRSALSGKRHVPRFAVTGGIAFLRIKKPQPAYLSRIIRDKRDRWQRRVDLKSDLGTWHWPIAHAEDEWDRRVRRLLHQRYRPRGELLPSFPASGVDMDDSEADEPTYTETVKQASDHLSRLRYLDRVRDRTWGERLFAIMQKERQLKYEEEGVLTPLRGRSVERRQIVARQRRERRERNAIRTADEAERKREREAKKEERKHRQRHSNGSSDTPFVVQLEKGGENK